MRTEGSHKAVAFSAIVFMLFGGYFAYAAFLTGQPSTMPGVQAISAKDGEDDEEDENEDEDEDEDEDEEDDEEEDEKDDEKKESEKREKEAAKAEKEKLKKEAERTRETAKRAAEQEREAAKRASHDDMDDDYVNGVKVRGDGSVDDTEEKDELEDVDEDEDRSAMWKDRDKTIEKLNEKIAEAEKEILKKQSEGVDVSAALAQLALAKARVSSVDAAFVANELEDIKSMAKEAEKLAHFARGKTLHDSEEVARDITKVEKRISQVKGKIALLSQLGGDTSAYLSSLAEAEAAFAAAKAQITAGGDSLLLGLAGLATTERRVKLIKNSLEGALFALGASDDEEFENEHGVEVGDVSDELSELADADEDHNALHALAMAHKSEAAKVSLLVQDLDDRNRIAKGLFGNDPDLLNELRSEAAVNEDRIAAMQTAADRVEDNALNLLMNEKIGELKAENAKLVSFISSQSSGTGVFGWFFRLF